MTAGTANIAGGKRLWSLDWIRAYAMLCGIPVHSGMIYSNGYAWFISSPEKSDVITAVTGILTSTRMPLFFFVAGLLSAINLSRRDTRAWIFRRIQRLGVPLVAATLVISPLVILAMAYDRATPQDAAGTYWQHLSGLLLRPGGQWVGHLWFLQVLVAYSLLTPWALVSLQAVKERYLRRDGDEFVITARAVFALAAAVSAYRFAVHGGFYLLRTANENLAAVGYVLQFEMMFDFLPYYLLGLLAYGTRLPDLHRNPLVIGFLAVAALYFADHWNGIAPFDKAIRYTFLGAMGMIATIAIFKLAEVAVTATGRITQSLIGASFTIYLFHYPAVVWLGILFKKVSLDPVTEYFAIIVLGFGLSWAVHVVVSRSGTLTFLFNGARPTGAPVPSEAPRQAGGPVIVPVRRNRRGPEPL